VTATTSERPAPPPDDETGADGPASTAGRIVYVLAAVVLLASFGTWGYVYSGAADRPPPDLLSDPAFAQRGEEVCAEAVADVAAMPSALDAADGRDRADQIRAATARFEQMVTELDGLVGGDDRDMEIQTGWLADWRVLLADRLSYAGAIAEDPDAQFYLTDTGAGERLDRRIKRLADTTGMYSCATPDDVG
jgi:hypothetical protein